MLIAAMLYWRIKKIKKRNKKKITLWSVEGGGERAVSRIGFCSEINKLMLSLGSRQTAVQWT